jgi:HAD superfamily hydrolase (TIGR01549 family)
MQTKWIFFDIGDVLFDEDAQHRYIFHSMLLSLRRNGYDVTWDDYFDCLRERARVKPGTAFEDAVRDFVPDRTRAKKIVAQGRAEYKEMRKPRPYGMLLDSMLPVIKDLRQDFRLGIIANQHPPILDALRDYGVTPYFDVIVIDEIVGVSKPDPKIFVLGCEQAGCVAEEAIFVGDRPDNDVAPAKSLGMGTVRFKRGQLYVYYDPRNDRERADFVVTDLMRLAPTVRRLAAQRAGKIN